MRRGSRGKICEEEWRRATYAGGVASLVFWAPHPPLLQLMEDPISEDRPVSRPSLTPPHPSILPSSVYISVLYSSTLVYIVLYGVLVSTRTDRTHVKHYVCEQL